MRDHIGACSGKGATVNVNQPGGELSFMVSVNSIFKQDIPKGW
jgi:hypothetical protein